MAEMTMREAAFHWTIDTTKGMPKTRSEIRTLGALGMLATSYLLGIETKCYRALAAIARPTSGKELVRKSEFIPIKSHKLRERRLKTVTRILVCVMFFDELGSEEMAGMLTLLATLAVDGSSRELYDVVAPLVLEAAKKPRSWSRLERTFPALCRLIEEDAATTDATDAP